MDDSSEDSDEIEDKVWMGLGTSPTDLYTAENSTKNNSPKVVA